MRCEDYFSMQIYVRFPGTGPLQIIGDKNLRTTLSFHVFSCTGKRLLDAAYQFQGGLITKCGDVAARTIYIWFPLNPRKKKKARMEQWRRDGWNKRRETRDPCTPYLSTSYVYHILY